jgi:hypothetical protein
MTLRQRKAIKARNTKIFNSVLNTIAVGSVSVAALIIAFGFTLTGGF